MNKREKVSCPICKHYMVLSGTLIQQDIKYFYCPDCKKTKIIVLDKKESIEGMEE